MPQAVAVLTFFEMVGVAVGFGFGVVAVAAGATIVVGGGLLAMKALMPAIPQPDSDQVRQTTVRSTIEPQKIIYGEALVSGPIVFVGVSADENRDLNHVIALAGHEVSAITDIYLDDEVITNAQISGGVVTSGTFGPNAEGNNVWISKFLGTATQAADPTLVSLYPGYTSAHQGKGIAYIRTTFRLTDSSRDVWDKYTPSNIRALVKGRIIYDPRLDTSPGANPTSATYAAYSDNPALCVADYLTNTKFGMKIAAAKVDWDEVVTAANVCDVVVSVPGGTEKRFTANGVLYATDPHNASIGKLLTAFNGSLIFTGGKYLIRAGAYIAPTETLNEDDLAGPLVVKTSVERADRFNTIGGIYINPADGHKSAEFPKVTITAALSRDNNEVLEKELELPFTNSSYMAQRIANKLIQMSDQQKTLSFPANMAGLRVGVGDRVSLSIDELGWSSKVFQCLGWSFGDDAGVTLSLVEDDAGSYADMAVIEYSTISYAGVITAGFPGVPDPQNLAATGSIAGISLDWTNPNDPNKFSTIIVYASPDSAWANAVEIGRGAVTSFFHGAANAADPITSGDTRWYWVRAANSGGVVGDRNPDNDVSTITATAVDNIADSVEWVDVADGGGLRPVNNATVGAILSTNLTSDGNVTTSGGTQLTDDDVLNSVVFEDITQVQLAGTGDILELIGGAAVDLQQLGDVAEYAFNADQVLNGYINGLNTSISNLQDTITDITSGVADVYVSDTAPVAGVGGVPDPIVTYSRWYDSDDNNAPYYWTGSAWVDLSDPRIASNEADIAAVSATLNTTNSTVSGQTTDISANASAISVIDATVINIDGDLTTLTGEFDAFVAAYVVSDPVAQTVVNSAAISALDVRVTDNEGLISTSATDITTLDASIEYYTKLEDVSGVPLEFVGGGEIDLQGTSAVGGATSGAINLLDARVFETETGLVSQASDIVVLTSAIDAVESAGVGYASAISDLETTVTSQGALITSSASDITTLSATVTANGVASADADSALDVRVSSAEGSITSQASLITGLQVELDASQLDISGNASAISGIDSRVTTAEGTIVSQASDISALDSSLTTAQGDVVANAGAISGIDVRVTSAEGSISSQASSITSLSTTVGGHTTSISTNVSSINGIHANYSVKIDNNSRITGFGLTSTGPTTTPSTTFAVIADRFTVVDPTSTSSTPLIPFTVASGLITMNTNVRISGDLVTSGTISADRLKVDGVTIDTDGSGNLIVGNGGVNTTQLANNAATLPVSNFTSGNTALTGVGDWILAQTVSLTSLGLPIYVSFSAISFSGSLFRITDNGSVLQTFTAGTAFNQPYALGYSFTPAAGAHVINVEISASSSSTRCGERSMFAMEIRR